MKSMIKPLMIMPLILTGLLLGACEQKPESSEAIPNSELALDANAADVNATDLKTGQQIYTLYCSACHNPGEGHAGTMKLALLKGEENSVITERSDLNAEYIRFVVRDGLLEMAPFRPTDINDGELDSLIQYILSNNSPNK
ncbi:MAG: cytochrome c [Porticoccaceae bacterium]|nr:cytochrome c [Porticoccaceae bacterium]